MSNSAVNVLSVRDLNKSFGKKIVLKNLNFSVARGNLVAVTGPSGCGKSTLLSLLGLLDKPESGIISINDKPVKYSSRSLRQFYRYIIGFLFQNFGLVEGWTIEKNLRLPLEVSNSILNHRGNTQKISGVLSKVGLEGRMSEKIYTLSGGEQQRVALARLLLKNPSLILADEPTSALDEMNGKMVMDTLRAMANGGALVFISTHNPNLVSLCDYELSLVDEKLIKLN